MGRDLVRRGLRSPMLVVTDGTPGLIRAIDELWAGQRPAAVYGALRRGPDYADVPRPGKLRWPRGPRHNQSASRKASSESEGRKRPGFVFGPLVRASARSLMRRSACK